MNDEALVSQLKEKCPGGKLTCSDARALAAEMGLELSKMGDLCDAAGIKICGCELGCF